MIFKHKLLIILMIALSIILIFKACKDDDKTINNAPICTITSLENGAEFRQGETITIVVEAIDDEENIQEVKFYVNSTEIGSIESFPYYFDWETSEEIPGLITIKAEAINKAQEKASDEIEIDLLTSGGTAVRDIVSPITGKTWMDRNLGASRVAQSSTDDQAYGDLYQWGRTGDGHEKKNSGRTSILSSTDYPDHDDFITIESSPWDWRSGQNDNLWQGVSGVNNPCPCGYRLPTAAELDAERASWSENNAASAFASPLKLPLAGSRYGSDGSIHLEGSHGTYWTSTVDSTESRFLYIWSYTAYMSSYYRAIGLSIRCIKE